MTRLVVRDGTEAGRRASLSATRWVVSLLFGLGAAGLVSHFPGSSETGGGIDRFQPEALAVGLVHGILSAAFVALAVALIMRPRRATLVGVFLAMALAIGISHALSDGLPASVPQFVVAGIGAVSLLAGAYLFLGIRRPVGLAVWPLSWFAGWFLGYWTADQLGLSGGSTWTQQHLVVGLVMALVLGCATAAAGSIPGAKDSARL